MKNKVAKIFKPALDDLTTDEHREAKEIRKNQESLFDMGVADKDGHVRPDLEDALQKSLAKIEASQGLASSFLETKAKIPSFKGIDAKIRDLEAYTKSVFEPSSFLQTKGDVDWQTKL